MAAAPPAGACDTHLHVFGPAAPYPAAAGARYALPDATPEAYANVARRLGLARAVLVQPSFYGSDNRCLLQALRELGPWTRGVVMLDADAAPQDWAAWHALGVRGIRLDLFKAVAQGLSRRDIETWTASTAELAAILGWSIDLYCPGPVAVDLAPLLVDLPAHCSIAHMGFLKADDGLTERQCEAFVEALHGAGNVWVKLTGAYRYGEGSPRPAMLARLLLQTMPTRVIWGSDWPHVMAPPQDTGECLRWVDDVIGDLIGDETTRRLVFAENAARLYGFAPDDVREPSTPSPDSIA